MIDIGISFTSIKQYLKDIQIVLLSHEHKDHINIDTLKRLQFERPSLRIGCGEFMLKHLSELKNIDIYEARQSYNYRTFKIIPIKLYHDCPNFGYRILTSDYKIIHATDTATLEGIEAKGYDLYALEFNYDEETINDIIESKRNTGQFAYEKGAINSHLSEQQANEFIFKNKGERFEILRLHQSTRYEI
ncbi:MAG: MBL fold metallo-hydrolase [Spirochaetota bacterium]|nr:MBL fold metallo-hydrolase [Spirochaetota bacterium]